MQKGGSPIADWIGSRLGGAKNMGIVYKFDPSDQLVSILPSNMSKVQLCHTVAQQAEAKWPGWNVIVLDPAQYAKNKLNSANKRYAKALRS